MGEQDTLVNAKQKANAGALIWSNIIPGKRTFEETEANFT